MHRLLVSALSALLASLALAASASAFTSFQTPCGNIGCGYLPESRFGPAVLRCDIRSGLRPEPARSCELDWVGVSLTLTGRAHATCAGDTMFGPNAPVLRYGQTWRRNGLACTSRMTGLRCTNRSAHGFFLSRASWSTF